MVRFAITRPEVTTVHVIPATAFNTAMGISLDAMTLTNVFTVPCIIVKVMVRIVVIIAEDIIAGALLDIRPFTKTTSLLDVMTSTSVRMTTPTLALVSAWFVPIQ